MGKVFTMASKDPNSVSYMVRDDLAIRNEESMDLLRAFADAASKRGEDGPAALLEIAETLDAVGKNPVLGLVLTLCQRLTDLPVLSWLTVEPV